MSQLSSDILTSNRQAIILKSQEIRTKTAVLKDKLSEAGVSLSFVEGPHILKQEQALVVRDLEKNLGSSNDEVQGFIKGLKFLCQKEKYFKKALLPTIFRKSDANETIGGSIGIQQESLFRILLKVNCLQKEVIDELLNEITSISSEEMQDTSWLRLLLNSLRYLPHIKEADVLTQKLLDILDVATFPAQLEILDSIPEIVPDSQYGETAKQLSKLLDENDELSGAIIDCLNALDLDSEIRSHVQDTILSKILAGTTLKIFPVLLQFLMTDCKSQNLVPTLLKVRNALDTIMLSSDNGKDKESCKILIFNKLQVFAISPKTIADAWLNMISSIKSHSDHRPVDYLLLFMLHTTAKFRKRLIEAIFRKRVHSGLFKVSMLETMFEKYLPQQLLKDYFGSIVEIGCGLLRTSGEPVVVEFASTLLRTLFNHEHMEVIYRRELLDSLILLTGLNNTKTVTSVLKLISSLLDGSDKLRKHTVLLMRLLEKLDSFELKDVKEVFEILCPLTCGENADESMSGLKDELHMVIRKQLCSSKRNIKHKGIVSAVVMAKHIALKSEEQTDVDLSDEPITSINMLPRGASRDAASLLEITSTCTTGCPELVGLYYDQLTAMLMHTNHLDKHFMAWLHETITLDFENTYAIQTVPEDTNNLHFSRQYLRNTGEEDSDIAINIAGLTTSSDNSMILLLAPHFRVLRLIHYRQQAGDLSSISALLGCAVILPEIQDFIDLDTHQVRQVADCLFHCVNWFREVINGFLMQKSRLVRAKVVRRLEDMVEVEKKLYTCMENAPEHKLPVSYFDSLLEVNKQFTSPVKQDKAKNPKKKFKSAPVVNETDDTVGSTSALTQAKKSKSTSKASTPELQINFREMDIDLVLLLKYPLILDVDDQEQSSTQTASLNIDQLKFILKDYVSKLTVLTQDKNIGLSHLNMVSIISVIKDSAFTLTKLDAHFKTIVKKINTLLESTDGRHDLPEMFQEEAIEVKTCFGLMLKIFHLTFTWTGFQYSGNLDLLKNILRGMRQNHTQSQSLNSANRLIVEFINRLASNYQHCLELDHAVSLVKTMEALYSVTFPSPNIEKKIVSVAEKLLSKRWYNYKGTLDAGKNCNANIDTLLKVYLKSANVDTISGLVGTLQDEAPMLNTKEDCLHMLASIDKQNFHIFYMHLCNALLSRVKDEVQGITNNQHLILWHTTVVTMQVLMSIAKAKETRTNLVCFLKKSIGILNIFLSHGIPILEIMLRSKPDEVLTIFKTMQSNTRFLHHLCCYSKLTKDASLVALVPKFRLTLETLVYRVKAALVANNCAGAFWMGTLRNKDLQGEDILSQSTVVTDDNEQNSDDELPLDESENELAIDENSSNFDNRSVSSEVFD